MHIYAIGDIHGHLGLLQVAHDLIADDMAKHGAGPVIHVGDLVDRGPDSRGVVDYLMQGQARGQDWTVLKGNHDRMFARFLHDPFEPEPGLRADLGWLHPKLGGPSTLASYGVEKAADRPVARVHAEALDAVPQAHLDYLNGLPVLHRLGETAFVHAGIRPGVALDQQTETDLIWIREPFLSEPASFGPLIVHGHTAIDHATQYGNRLNLDSGAAYGGPLSAVVIEGREAALLTPTGRKKLTRAPA
ncbi:metallophosphoesterase family protein [Tabrizicola sp.]|jgi:serine/threonine protein phosphatase 1|uniref:metallophosphoesterase family protein n=1 Tax=Tabrizicola sp. TaxID=2005166 RepID=UPI001A536BC1|nr:metallophosphoesterase family protein [Tabrizicola sp.]MBL9064085.1 serine/threonine protein phosphatase [Tabrizicola sp.]